MQRLAGALKARLRSLDFVPGTVGTMEGFLEGDDYHEQITLEKDGSGSLQRPRDSEERPKSKTTDRVSPLTLPT